VNRRFVCLSTLFCGKTYELSHEKVGIRAVNVYNQEVELLFILNKG